MNWQNILFKQILMALLLYFDNEMVECKTVGPDPIARVKLLRNLPLNQAYLAQSKINVQKQGITNIDISISVRSVDLNFVRGIFAMDGSIALR